MSDIEETEPPKRRVFIDPSSKPTITIEDVDFKLRVMTVREYEERKDLTRFADLLGKIQVRVGTWTVETLRRGLTGWSSKTADVPPFETDERGYPTEETLTFLDPVIRKRLVNEIEKVQTVGPEEVKD